MTFKTISMLLAVALSTSGWLTWKSGLAASSPGATPATSSSTRGTVTISRQALRQCEIDAAKADRYDEMRQEAQKAQRREDRAAGALDLCERGRRKAQRQRTWLTAGVIVEAVALAGTTVWALWERGR